MKILGFELFLSRGLYGERPALHFDLYRQEPGYWFAVAGSWTLEVETPPHLRCKVRMAGAAVAGLSLSQLAVAYHPNTCSIMEFVTAMLRSGHGV